MENIINQNPNNASKEHLYYKIMLIGSKCVGKTQILKKFCKEEFEEQYIPTFGMDFRIQKYFFENSTITIQIIEVSGSNVPPLELLKDYILDADCFLCIYDISKRDSVNELNNMVSNYERIIGLDNKAQCWYFVGNKSDMINKECSNNPSDIFGYTPLGTIGFIEISAKENKFIENMFNNAIFQIKRNKRKNVNDNVIMNSHKQTIVKPKNENNPLVNQNAKKSHCSIF